MSRPRVVVLGGGLAGLAAAWVLADHAEVTLFESGASLGGLAGSFERNGHFYPLGYHHILHRDHPLLFFLDRIGALPSVRWRRVRMAFHLDGQFHELGSPRGFAAFPMSLPDKLRFVRLMLRAFGKRDWSDWEGRTATDLIDGWAGPGVRKVLFERLTRLKFELPCDEVSGAWLGARLHYREGSAPLGYIPDTNWTTVLCDGVGRLVRERGVEVHLHAPIHGLITREGRIVAAQLADGTRVEGDLFVSAVPTEVYRKLTPADPTPHLNDIRYSALISVVCATRSPAAPDYYWTNLASLDTAAAGVFRLDALNPTIGGPDEACVNFVTHLRGRDRPMFRWSDQQLMDAYQQDFQRVFGAELDPLWSHVARVPMYSAVFGPGFRNMPVRSTGWPNLYFAGNYRTFPSIVSTGTALASGLEAAAVLLADRGERTDLPERAAAFHPASMPRA